ncbi:hypothetical protein BDY24DRAFT_411557 [Mrakia frigida]|uniref:uncharacterized protein n=1 Tax=Mrakia frigida TaxID=29902 RepID=UPI003FCC1A77
MAPKRPLPSNSTTTKRKKAKTRAWGVVSADEEAMSSSNGLVSRSMLQRPRTLASCCLLAFGKNLRKAFEATEQGGGLREEVLDQLRWMPDHLKERLWEGVIVRSGSGLVSAEVIASSFVGSSRIVLPGDSLPSLANLKRLLSLRLPPYPNRVTHLEISGIPEISDTAVAQAIRQCVGLRSLVLRGTTKVGEKSLKAIIDGKHDSSLKNLNLSSTSVKPINLVDVLALCLGLEELKLANLQGFNDNALGHMLDAVLVASRDANATSSPLQNLTKLKLRGAKITATSLDRLLSLTPSLSSLDISLTTVKSLPSSAMPNLTKLHLTGSKVSPSTLVHLLATSSPPPRLRTLNIGGLMGNWTPEDIVGLSDLLAIMVGSEGEKEGDWGLEKMTLAGNQHLLGSGSMVSQQKVQAFSLFMEDVGRHIRHLDLSLNPIHSAYLTPLSLPGSRLEHLVLDETGVDSGLGEVLVGCKNLDTLSLKASKVDVHSLFRILQACPRISTLDLTSKMTLI